MGIQRMDERVRYHGMFDVIGEKPETYGKKTNQQYSYECWYPSVRDTFEIPFDKHL